MEILIALLAVSYAVLCIRNIRLALYVLCGTLPSYLLRFSFFGVPSTLLEVFIWILFLVWLFRTRGACPQIAPSFRLPITLLLLSGIVGVLVAPDTFAAVGLFKAYILEPLFVFIVALSILQREHLRSLFLSFSLSALLISIVAIFQKLTGIGIPEPWDTARRVVGLFEYPNALGLFLAPILTSACLLALLPVLHDREVQVTRILYALTALLGCISIIFSQTEAAWIAAPVAATGSLLLSPYTSRSKILGAVIGIVAVATFVVFVPYAQPFQEKILLKDWSGQVRKSQWNETWNMLTDEPQQFLFGAGLAGYSTALTPYHKDTRFEIFQYPHNIFLNTWTELGVIGLISLLGLIGPILRLAWRSRRDPYVLAAFAALTQMFIHGLVDVPYFKNDLAVLTWIFIAVLVIADQNRSLESARANAHSLHPSR